MLQKKKVISKSKIEENLGLMAALYTFKSVFSVPEKSFNTILK